MTAGTSVVIIDMPNKVGWNDDQLYLEAHQPLSERSDVSYASLNGIVNTIQSKLPKDHVTLIDWQLVAYLTEDPDGIPHEIGVRLN